MDGHKLQLLMGNFGVRTASRTA